MAIYHLSVQLIKRSDGRSVVAAAAYRSGECLESEYDGIERDYTHKNWVEYTNIMLPENAPEEYKDRSVLWNSVEISEKSGDAQLAREFEIALPVELSKSERIELIEQFVQENCVSKGMIADIAIHNPPVHNDRGQYLDKDGNVTKKVDEMQFINPHAHVLCTVRPIDENGKWEKKSEVEYICKKDGVERKMTASEYAEVKEQGWEKQYKYIENDKKVYHTPSEATDLGLERASKTARTTPFGRKNPTVEYWNSQERILEWRKAWEICANNKLEASGSAERIDSRSFKDQGKEDEIPTIHMGPSATNIERRADRNLKEGVPESEIKHSDVGNINRQIKEHNRFVRQLKEAFAELTNKAKKLGGDIEDRIKELRERLRQKQEKEDELVRERNSAENEAESYSDRMRRYEELVIQTEELNAVSRENIDRFSEELDECTILQFRKRASLQRQIHEEETSILNRSEFLEKRGHALGFDTVKDVQTVLQRIEENEDRVREFDSRIEQNRQEQDSITDTLNEAIKEKNELFGHEKSEKESLDRENEESIGRNK